MAFAPVFPRTFSETFRVGNAASAAVSWWLSGGIVAASVSGVWQAKAAASLDASYLRLGGDDGYSDIDPAVVGGVAPTWNSTAGWIFDGSSQYLLTNIVPTAHASCAIVRFTIPGITVGDFLFGSSGPSGGADFSISPYDAGSVVRYASGSFATKSPQLTSGTLAVVPLAGYRNGVSEVAISAWGSNPSYGIIIGGRNTNGTPGAFASCSIQAIAIYKTAISAAQVLAVHTAISAL